MFRKILITKFPKLYVHSTRKIIKNLIFVQQISKRRLINYFLEINSHNFFNKIALPNSSCD